MAAPMPMSGWQFERWMVTPSAECSRDAGRLGAGKKKDRARLRVCWRTAASKHRRSYAITAYSTTNVSAMQV